MEFERVREGIVFEFDMWLRKRKDFQNYEEFSTKIADRSAWDLSNILRNMTFVCISQI
jgi:hypothetical protein